VAKKRTSLIFWLLGFAVLIGTATVVGVILLIQGAPSLTEEGSPPWLHVRITPMIVEAPGNEGFVMDPADMAPLTTELAQAITDAATDDGIGGLFLEIEGIGVGWAQTQELRDAIWHFRTEGKPSIAWAEHYGNKEYYLASAAQEIHMAPEGLSLVNGLSVTQMYYANAFEKFGISSNFEHVGDFKSAVEPFERTGPSPEAVTATEALLDSVYGQMIRGIATGRGIDTATAQALINDPPMTPASAHTTGLVDALHYRDQVKKSIDSKLKKVKEYIQVRRDSWQRGGPKVAVIYAEGTIVSGQGGSDLMGSQRIGSKSLNKIIRKVRNDNSVVAVVLRVNSPGGSGVASDAIWREVGRTLDKKPVVVSMGDYAASGGYYISMGADRIIAQPGTLTGSIGVFGGKLNLSGLYGQLGLSLYEFERGDRADILSHTEDFDPYDKAKFRSFLESFYQSFVHKAAKGRSMSFPALEAVAQGRVWTGEQALEHGLVDQLGGLDVAISAAAELADVQGSVSIERYPERLGFIDQLIKDISDPEPAVMVPDLRLLQSARPVQEALKSAMVLDEILTNGGVAAILPGNLTVH